MVIFENDVIHPPTIDKFFLTSKHKSFHVEIYIFWEEQPQISREITGIKLRLQNKEPTNNFKRKVLLLPKEYLCSRTWFWPQFFHNK